MTPTQQALALDALRTAVLQNDCDMLMTGEELRKCRAAIASLEAARAVLASHDAAQSAGEAPVPAPHDWEPLAMLLAEQDGQEPHTLIWQGNPPEPWGEVWMKYEPQALAVLKLLGTGKPECAAPPSPAVERDSGPMKLQWSEERNPTEEVHYNHVTAATPFGRFLITWKSWKDHDWPTIDETPWGDFFGSFPNIESAKHACEQEFATRVQQCLAARAALEGEKS